MHGEELQYVNEAFEKNWIAPVGFNIDNLEKTVDEYINAQSPVKYRTLAVCSGTAALHLVYKVAGITKGTPVFVSDSRTAPRHSRSPTRAAFPSSWIRNGIPGTWTPKRWKRRSGCIRR